MSLVLRFAPSSKQYNPTDGPTVGLDRLTGLGAMHGVRPNHAPAQIIASSVSDATAVVSSDTICVKEKSRSLCFTGTYEPVAAAIVFLHENAAAGAVLEGETYGKRIVPDVMAVASLLAVAAKYLANMSDWLKREARQARRQAGKNGAGEAEALETLAEVACNIGASILSKVGLLVGYQRALLDVLGYDHYYSPVLNQRYTVGSLQRLEEELKDRLEARAGDEQSARDGDAELGEDSQG